MYVERLAAVPWRRRLLTAAVCIPIVASLWLWSALTSLLLVGAAVFVASKEHSLHRKFLLDNFCRTCERLSEGIQDTAFLTSVALLYLGACYADPDKLMGNNFFLLTQVTVVLIPLGNIYGYVTWKSSRSDREGDESAEISYVLCKCGLDLLFYFHYVWSLAVVVYFRKQKGGTECGTLLVAYNFIGDAGALVMGSLCGRRKLATVVSPAKSLEGIMGSLLWSEFTAVACYFLKDSYWAYELLPHWSLAHYIATAAIAVSVGTIGDFFESAFKRAAKTKDSSQLFGAHGGMLDRLDSLSLVVPFFYIYIVKVILE